MKRPALVALIAAAALALGWPARASDAPFPTGTSTHTLEGVECVVSMPKGLSVENENGLVFALHGYGFDPKIVASNLRKVVEAGYVVVVPAWETEQKHKQQVEVFHEIIADLRKRLNVPERRLHALIMADGYQTLQVLAFQKEPRFRTACYASVSYFRGGKLGKPLRDSLGVLTLLGESGRNVDVARRALGSLRGKVRACEVRVEPGGDEKPPLKLLYEYYPWWLRMQEGECTPGDTRAFDWKEPDLSKPDDWSDVRPSFVYWYRKGDTGWKAREFQNDLLHDPLVQHYGSQLRALRADADSMSGQAAYVYGVTTTPAVTVHVPGGDGDPKKMLVVGETDAKALAAALRSVAPNKKKPW